MHRIPKPASFSSRLSSSFQRFPTLASISDIHGTTTPPLKILGSKICRPCAIVLLGSPDQLMNTRINSSLVLQVPNLEFSRERLVVFQPEDTAHDGVERIRI